MARSSLYREERISVADDIICNLPECIIHKILVDLPIKEAVRTSILSKSWRHTWSTIPDLIVNVPQNIGIEGRLRIDEFVDKFFSRHKGNLHKFKLSGEPRVLFPVRWIKTLSQKHVSEFILENDTDYFVCIHGISSCQNLKSLVLRRCFIFFPKKFDGFKWLCTVDLTGCIFLEMGITELVSFCPLLEKLKLKFAPNEGIKIHASNLCELTICGTFAQVSLQTPNLRIANFVTPESVSKATSRTLELRGNLIKQPIYISDISFGNKKNDMPSSSALRYFLQKYPVTTNYLTTMVMILAPSKHCTHQLFQGVPTLQKLIVYLEPSDPSSVSSAYKVQAKIFPCLREATIIPFFNSDTVYELAEIILTNALLLERLTIGGEMKDCQVSKLNEIRKQSKKAEIIFRKSYFCAEAKYQGCCCSECDIVAW